jgi:ketosteroid isomerase-like protein
MGEQENTRLVQEAYQRVRAGEFDAFLNALDSAIEWHLPAMENVPFAGTWRGREGVREFFRTVRESQEIVEFKPEQFVAQGDTVVVLGRFVMRVKSTGRESASLWAHVWTIAGGKIAHYREYVDTATVSIAHRASPLLSRQAARSS